MEVSIIIPVYNHLDLTRECLDSLKETTAGIDYEVILVDDGSAPDIKAGLQDLAGERVKLITSPLNQGYAHANNLGALHAKGKYLVLANNDLVFLKGWLPPMLAAFRKLARPGIVGNVQLNAKTGEVDHAGIEVTIDTSLRHIQTVPSTLGRTPAYSRVHLITAACCAIPRKLFLDLGGFDEAFLNGGEDVDLCFRVRQLGLKIYVSNKSRVRHHVSFTRHGRNLNTEANSRLVQRKWDKLIATHAASQWPDQYLKETLAAPLSALNPQRTYDAALRFLTLRKGPSPVALTLANCELHRKERHWKSLLDGMSDSQIRKEERNMHASPLQDSYKINGLYPTEDKPGVWIREQAQFTLPRGTLLSSITLSGTLHPDTDGAPETRGELGLQVTVNGIGTKFFTKLETGEFKLHFPDPPARADEPVQIELKLLGTARSNTYAYLGRVLANKGYIPSPIRGKLAKYRPQALNKRLCIEKLDLNGQNVFNFALNPTNPLNTEYALEHAELGVNLVGWFKAQLGIGESARLAAKVLKNTQLPYALVPLKVNCMASQGDTSLDAELQDSNPHPINIFHIDAPQSADIDHHHSPQFRKGKRNIAYWAWELPDFPDRWIKYFQYFDEIWTPSDFVRNAVAMKSPVPVLTMPHCIDFEIPAGDYREILGLPKDQFLFCFAYDLNSYQERKNPKAIIEAYRQAFTGNPIAKDVGLVIKIHSSGRNQENLKELKALLADIPNYHLIDRTLSREDTYGLMKACDSYVSLHRSEGFGLTVAESMFLGKPVISTNWSATSEFVNAENGCPVAFKLKELERDFGPYEKGQLWADPDPADAARQMLRLATDPELAARLGQNARQTIKELYSPQRLSSLYENRFRALALWQR
ncbi:glycosyltransferase [Pelagicoccus mobilis]|uniref:Glycosyltransferase n=1 Tax=Pelagicoccus mobilis TaxID=415221 RepID=A0A934RY06_9BACT|nr:glycosyltransferase [Pelagicoccus mobilis]MBK1878413.1 glycosyltransferase [Pelagicoccus mobilis]